MNQQPEETLSQSPEPVSVPATEVVASDVPPTDVIASDAVTAGPVAVEAATEAPASEAPASEAPATEAPVAEEKPVRPDDGYDHLRAKLRKRENVMARVIKWQRNGLEVELEEGTRAFMPNDMIDRDPNRNIANYFGKTVPVKVTSVKVVARKPEIAVSHRAVIEEELREKGKEVVAALNVGDVIDAKIKGFNSQGALVDLGEGVDAVIRTPHLTWAMIEHPYEAVKRGEEVKAKILMIDKARRRVQLGIRQLTRDPFIERFEKFNPGDVVKGTVHSKNDFGAELAIEEGITAFLPISEISWSRIASVDAALENGEEFEVKVLTTDKETRRITVSRKQLVENPLRVIESTYKIGSEHNGTVKEVNRGGVVVALPHNAEGFVPRRELSHDRIERLEDSFKLGKEMTGLRVMEYDRKSGKITMSLIEGERIAEKNAMKDYKATSSASSFTIGDLSSLKAKLEKLERGE